MKILSFDESKIIILFEIPETLSELTLIFEELSFSFFDVC